MIHDISVPVLEESYIRTCLFLCSFRLTMNKLLFTLVNFFEMSCVCGQGKSQPEWSTSSKLHAIGFFNEADTLESSSILIYSHSKAGLYTQSGQQDAVKIKMVIKLGN